MTEQDERLAWRSPGGRLTDPVGAATVTFRSGSRRHQVHSHPGAVAPSADDTPEGHDLCRRIHTDVGTRRRGDEEAGPGQGEEDELPRHSVLGLEVAAPEDAGGLPLRAMRQSPGEPGEIDRTSVGSVEDDVSAVRRAVEQESPVPVEVGADATAARTQAMMVERLCLPGPGTEDVDGCLRQARAGVCVGESEGERLSIA